MDAAPVIARGHNVAVFIPPVTEAFVPVFEAVNRRPLLILAPDRDLAVRLASLAGEAGFAVSGLERACRRLGDANAPGIVASSVDDALELLERSALHPERFRALVLAWPELLDHESLAALEAVMAEADRECQRVIATAAPGPDLDGLIERYAFKAMTYGFPPVEPPEGWSPPRPSGRARYVLAHPSQFAETRRRILDALNPERDEDLLIITCPASRNDAEAAALRAPDAGPVVVAEPYQIGWLRSLFSPLVALPLPGLPHSTGRKVAGLRARLARTAEREDLTRELLVLAPLLERFDSAVLAAAALRMTELTGQIQPGSPDAPAEAAGVPVYTRLWVGIGRKDGARPGDLVAALANDVKVPASCIGKIDVRELFTLLEIKVEHAEQAVKGLTGLTLRGRRLVARLDRGPLAGSRAPRRG